jgi:ABC-type sugar transport system ATPase subunit
VSSSQIEFRGVSKTYTSESAALDSLTLTVSGGERLAVLGPSGSGKTTLLRLIAGLEVPDSGSLKIGGLEMCGVPPHRRDVAMVFQNPALYPHLSVLENLAFGLKARGVGRRERRTRAGEVADLLGLGRHLTRRPDELSGGERQRVALGRAVARRPSVLLLDEPFSNLDAPLRAALRAELLALHHRLGSTLVHVTHDQGEALSIGDRVAVLHEGRLMQLGSPEQVYEEPGHRFVGSFVGSPGMNLIEVEVVRHDDTLRLTTFDGKRSIAYRAECFRGDGLLPSGEPRKLELGIRPRWVVLSSEELIDQTDPRSPYVPLPAIVRRVEFQGDSLLVTVEADGRMMTAETAGCRKFREGDRVVALLELGRASWFDPATGRRLELHCQSLSDSIA